MVVIRKMKEKCKDAARKRREKERAEFVELSKLLPLPSSVTNQLDKASIIRLTSSYLRMRTAFPEGLGDSWGTRGRKGRTSHGETHTSSSASSSDKFSRTSRSVDCSQVACANNQSSSETPRTNNQQCYIRELGSLILQTLDGFVFALHRDGKIMYISETASVLLGLPQIDLTGSSVFEYVHPADHNDILNILNLNDADREEISRRTCELNNDKREHASTTDSAQVATYCENEAHCIELNRSFCMRMKCILPKRNAGLVNNGYKAIHCSGYLKVRRRPTTAKKGNMLISSKRTNSSSSGSLMNHQQDFYQQDRDWESYALVAVGHSLLPTASTEIKLGTSTFMFRANLDFKLYYIEAPVIKLLGYQQFELIGQSLYQFIHVADLGQLEQAHKQLLDKGQVVSKYYRLMRQDGGHIWMQTFATLVNNPRSMPKPQHIVGICYVIGADRFDDSRSVVLNLEPQTKTPSRSDVSDGGLDIKCKQSNDACPQLLKQNMQINIDCSSHVPKTKQIDKHTNKRLRKLAGQQQQAQVMTSQHRDSVQTSFQYKQLAADEQSSQRYASPIYSENNPVGQCNTIGSIRRPSDDTCSIVSTIASSCVSSSSSGCSSNLSGVLSCPHSSSSSSASSTSSLSMTSSESILPAPAFSYTTRANSSAQFQYYEQAPAPGGTSHYQQQVPGTMDDGMACPEVNWLMPTIHHTNYGSTIETSGDQAKMVGTTLSDIDHAPYDLQDSRWQPTANSPTTTILSSTSSTVATNPISEDSPPMIGPILASPERTYFNDQYYHRLDEQPIEDRYYHDCVANYHNVVPIYLDSKSIRAMPYDRADNSNSHSYQYHYTSPNNTACLSGNAYL